MKKTIGLFVALLAAAVLGGSAQASVAVSSTSVAGVVLIAAPPTNSVTIIKALRLCNDTASALCVQFKDGTSIKTMLCAAAQACVDTPHESPNQLGAGPSNSLASFLGENLYSAAAFSVAGATAAANAAGGATITASYSYQPLR